jgi:hypothetical protein
MASPNGPQTPTGSAGPTFAWHIHAAMESWTSRADLKASILLALQGAVLVAAITSAAVVGRSGWAVTVALGGIAVLMLAAGLTATATVPALGSTRAHRRASPNNFIYFGHVRHRPADRLAEQLAAVTEQDQVAMLARQLVVMSVLNWRKHRLLQISMLLTVTAVLMLIGAAVMNLFETGRVVSSGVGS